MDIGTIGDTIDRYGFEVTKHHEQNERRWCCDVLNEYQEVVGTVCAYRADDAVRQGMEVAYHDAIQRGHEARQDG